MSAPPAYEVVRWTAATRLDGILALLHRAFAGLTPPSSVLKETVADIAARQRDGIVLVAQADGAFVGSLFAAAKADALYLTRLAVLPAWRRRGAGRALLQAAEGEARRLGMTRLTLRVRVSLPANLAYFERLGFDVTGHGQDPGLSPYYAMERSILPPT